MKNTKFIPEVFKLVKEAKTKKDKIAVLHEYQSIKGFYDILKLTYDPKCEWKVTRKEIEHLVYQDMDIAYYDLAPTTLFLEARRRLYNFTNAKTLKKEKVIKLIARMFSSLYHEEVEFFKCMVDGDIGVSVAVVREAFPGMLNDDPKPPKKKPGRPKGKKKAPVKKTAPKKKSENVNATV
jgi:hypothetical protein